MNTSFFIYKLTSPNGKVYIGQTSNINRRFGRYRNLDCKGQPKLYMSLKKYGWSNFKKEILFDGVVSQKEINEIETKYILEYIKNGLNISLKGNGGNGYTGELHPMSKAIYQIDLNFNIVNEFPCGEQASFKLNFKQSCISKACRTDKPKAYNFYWRFKDGFDKEDLIKKALMPNSNSISIYQLDKETNEIIKEWSSQIKASEKLNINQSNIWRVLIGKGKSAGGFAWVYKKEYGNNYNSKFKPKKTGKNILVKDLSGNVLYTFDSISKASRDLKVDKSAIIRQLKNKVLNPQKYIYEYLV